MQDLFELDIETAQCGYKEGTFTARDVTAYYLTRIASLNDKLKAVIQVNPDALFEAEAADRAYRRGDRLPLLGIPVLLKDNIETAGLMRTTAGAVALEHHFAGRDAELVRRLREHGAVILGKTNLSEWANFLTEDMPNGWSGVGGQTLNPYGDNLDVGGSSSGSAAAVAANLTMLAVGSETSGSIIHPSVHNGIVGIKPTVGLISRSGIIPISRSQDTAGPMARTLRDAVLALEAMCGEDDSDPATTHLPAGPPYRTCLDERQAVGMRVGFVKAELSDEEQTLYQEALALLKASGVELVEVDLPSNDGLDQGDVLYHEFKLGIEAYLATTALPYETLKDLMDWNKRHPETIPHGQVTFEKANQLLGRLTESSYLERRLADVRHAKTDGLDRLLMEQTLHALALPHDLNYDMAAKAGHPTVTIPYKLKQSGAPFGLSFTGTSYAERDLIRIAYAFERHVTRPIPPM
ncbi:MULTISPECIES: amidase family protein [unclassified Exiguobacterium]|uniref:amidase family protein n=1 Tax=unclassified Exiguobacterium TaxID=2644629 RepID=UPI00103D0E51|nr:MULTISPECIES: amidase family protein [unclassified Exiguobacterium]TCI24732.1 amidase [Exiguobacterium sp. SH5S4]TCI62646.1 amidase [Exiguobacterium sp. SH3S1]